MKTQRRELATHRGSALHAQFPSAPAREHGVTAVQQRRDFAVTQRSQQVPKFGHRHPLGLADVDSTQ
jgi:hypothetical protein